MYMDEGLDTGDIILQEKVEILSDETGGELWDRLSKIGSKLLVKTIDQIEKVEAPKVKQGNDFTMAPMIDREMSKIDWRNKTALEIKNLVRALNPIMGTYTFLNNKKIKIWKVDTITVEDFINKYPEFGEYKEKFDSVMEGTIIYVDIKEALYIKAKDEIIKILEIQAENSKKMSIQDFLRGNKVQVADRFV